MNLCAKVLIALIVFSATTHAAEPPETILDRKVHLEEDLIRDIPPVPRLCDAMNLPKEHIDIGGCMLYCEREGQNGPPMVLLHGGPGCTHHIFHPSFSKAAQFARVIYYDQRGCGLSDFKPGPGYTVDQAVDDFEHLRAKLGVGKWIVVGHSYGGLLAKCYAVKYPDSLLGLVLVGASTAVSDRGGSRQGEFMTPEETNRIGEIRKTPGLSTELNVYNAFLNGDWKRQYFNKPSRERIAQIALYEWKHDAHFNSRMSGDTHRIHLDGLFKECPIPTLIFEGKWDMTWDTSKPDLMKTEHPRAELVLLDKSGHQMFDDEPKAFFGALQKFAAGLKALSEADLTPWKARLAEWKASLPALARTLGYGRQSSEKIAKAYTKEGLEDLENFDEFLRIGFALYDVKRYEEALYVFSECAGYPDDNTFRRAEALIWQGHMLDLLGKRTEAVAAYQQAADMHLRDVIRHDQYDVEYSLDTYPGERLKSPFSRVENRQKE